MLNRHIIATKTQKVLFLLTKFSDMEFYEREVSRVLDISAGAANRALNELFLSRAVKRKKEGKMLFYSVNSDNAVIHEMKKVINLLLIEPLVENLKPISTRVVLFGSCAQGTDTSLSDLDLFVVSNDRQSVSDVITEFRFPPGYEGIHIQPVIKTPVELLESGDSERVFLDEVERGIQVWERIGDGHGI